MKVILINTLYHPFKVGGAELSVQALAEKLNEMGVITGIITLGKQDDACEVNGVKIWRIKIENIFWPFEEEEKSSLQKLRWHYNDVVNNSYKDKINTILNQFKPDIINTNNLSGFSVSIWELFKNKKIKIVHTLRDYYLICPKTTKYKKGKTCTQTCLECGLLSYLKKRASHKVDAVVGISEYILNKHNEHGFFKNAKKSIQVNGFDLKNSISRPIIFGDHTQLRLGFIGQINKTKGIELLLQTLSHFNSYNNWELHVAGKISESQKSKLNRFQLNEKLKFTGYIEQKHFFDKINVLIVPSIWEEPFGRVVLEGLINGKVVLASNKGGLKELLKNNTQFIFEPNEKELKKLIGAILNKPTKLNLFKHENTFINQFSLTKSAKEYQKLFCEMIEE